MADDLGYGDLGCYGQARIKTPNLDRLAADGMRFTQAYAGSTVCAPSRCSLMTGLHTGHALIRGNGDQFLRPQDVTLAEVLKKGGYHTGLIGKWGLGNENTPGVPEKQGFDEFLGYLDQVHAHDYYTDALWRYDDRTRFSGQIVLPPNQAGKRGKYIPDLLSQAGMNYIRINKPDPSGDYRSFFLFLSYTIPHANNEEAARGGNGMQVPDEGIYANESWPPAEKGKAAMITRMDADIGHLLDLLDQLKIRDQTLIVFTSDNGPHKEGGVDPKFFNSSGGLRGFKRDLYEGGIRVPLIVCWPGKVKPGQVNEEPWAFWDVLPTMADIARVKPPKDIDGISMLPTLAGRTQTNHHEFLYWEFHERGFQQAARMGDWKAVRLKPEGPIELYNLRKDPSERDNVANAHPDIRDKLGNYLKSARTNSERWPIKKASEEPSGTATSDPASQKSQ
jgi:arylsulfatase A-like enzyme